MRTLLPLFALALCLVAPMRAEAVSIGSEAPDLGSTKSFNTADGRAIPLASLHGKVVLIDFWATWCGPCVAAIPHVQELHDKYAASGLVAIGHTDSSSQNLESFIKEKKITYTISLGKDIGNAWGVTGIPRVFILDVDGKILWEGHPSQLPESVITDALKKVRLSAPTAIEMPKIDPLSSVAKVAKAQALVNAGKVGSGLAQLQKLEQGGKDGEREAAGTAAAALTAWIDDCRSLITKRREAGDVYNAQLAAEAVDKALAGHDGHTEFADLGKSLKEDAGWKVGKEFQALSTKVEALKGPAKKSAIDKFIAKNPDGYYAEAARALAE